MEAFIFPQNIKEFVCVERENKYSLTRGLD